jgi:hypothetical protein
MDASGNDDGRAAVDGWQPMGRRWPDWLATWRQQGKQNGGGGGDARQCWQEGAGELGLMQLADELALRRERRAAITAERAALDAALVPQNTDTRIPTGWEVWRPPEIGEDPPGWLDPGGPDHQRDLSDWRADIADEFGGPQLAPAVELAAGELDAAGSIKFARARLRKALDILDGIDAELDELDQQAAAKLDAACHPDRLNGGPPAGVDDEAAELGGVGDQGGELGGRGPLVEGGGDGGELVDEAAELGDDGGELGEVIDQAHELGELGSLSRGDA